MDYALCATYGYLPMKPLSIPSTLRATKLSFNSSLSAHLVYNGFTRLRVTKPVSPAIRAVNKSASPSSDDKRGAKILKGAIGASLVLACAIGVFNCSCNLKPTAIAFGPRLMHSKSSSNIAPTQLLGGKTALKSLLEVSTNLTSSGDKPLNESALILPPTPSTADISNLKMEAVRSGKIDKAMESLEKAYNDCKNTYKEQALEADLAIAAILISQGKYLEASKRNCLDVKEYPGPGPSDPRIPLYKAVVFTMLDKYDEAKKWWGKYSETVGPEMDPYSLWRE